MKTNNIFRRYLLVMFALIIVSVTFIGCNAAINSQNPPTVDSTFPLHGATGVSSNGTITAIFDDSVDAASLTTATFTLSNGGTDVLGKITYDAPSKTAIFAPSANLAYATAYSAMLTTGVKNTEGTAMTEAKQWSFTTAAAGAGPAPVLLGTAANYAILAKTTVTTTGVTDITGNLGLSPAATSFFTGFSLTNATGYATSTLVSGSLYAADMVPPTNINLTTAVEDMLSAYTDAVGRSTDAILDRGAGEIGSTTLEPGLYRWTSPVTIGSDVTLNGGVNDVWIFQISGDLSISSGFDVILSGGAQPKNIFWQVAGGVTLGTGSHFEGIVMSQTNIAMNTGSSINGRLLAQTQITLDQATVTKPAM